MKNPVFLKRTFYRLYILILTFIQIFPAFTQTQIEFLGLENQNLTSLSINYGIIAAGTDGNGVYWQFDGNVSETAWAHINLDAISVQTVYAHKSGPLGWAISAGVHPDELDSTFVYCSFTGGAFEPNSEGISRPLTSLVYELDGFPDPTVCGETYAAGNRALYRRQFGDTTWSQIIFTTIEGNIQTVKVRQEFPGVVLVGGGEGFTGWLLTKSLDFGDTWTTISPFGYIMDIDFSGVNADTIFAAAWDKIFRSFDGGLTWETVLEDSSHHRITEVIYDAENHRVYAAGGNNITTSLALLVFSNDNGDTWQQFPLEMDGPINALEFGLDDWIYFTTPEDGVFRFRDLIVGVEETENDMSSIALFQNYPNPVRGSTTIQYYIPKTTPVVLKIYNTSGYEVAELVDQSITAGKHSVTWHVSDIPDGVYYYVIKAPGKSAIRKAFVIR